MAMLATLTPHLTRSARALAPSPPELPPRAGLFGRNTRPGHPPRSPAKPSSPARLCVLERCPQPPFELCVVEGLLQDRAFVIGGVGRVGFADVAGHQDHLELRPMGADPARQSQPV